MIIQLLNFNIMNFHNSSYLYVRVRGCLSADMSTISLQAPVENRRSYQIIRNWC